MRKFVLPVLLALVAVPALAQETAAPETTPQAEYTAGWVAIISPTEEQKAQGAMQARQEALLSALPHFEAAVEGAPDNTDYRIGLAYAQLAAGKYQQAKDTLTAAIDRKKDDPVLYLLRAQADAALNHIEPDTTAQNVETALRSFDDAARLDPGNALYDLQAASVAFDAQRADLGLARVRAALKLPGMTLPTLPIPFDLDADRTRAAEMWQALQMRRWLDLLARCQNAAFALLKQGEIDEKTAAEMGSAADQTGAGEESAPVELTAEQKALYDKADKLYRVTLDIGRQMGNAKPNQILTVNMGLNVMEASYAHLLHAAEATGSSEANRWRGEGGVLQIGRGELFAVMQQYAEYIKKTPPSTAGALMKKQGEVVARVMLGIGLSPTEKPKPLAKPKQAAEESAQAEGETPTPAGGEDGQ